MKSTIFKISLVCIMIVSILIMLTGCTENNNKNKVENEIRRDNETAESKIDKDNIKDDVSELVTLRYKTTIEDNVYRIPKIDESLNDAKDINEDIEKTILSDVKEKEYGRMEGLYGVNYSAYEYGNIISIVINENMEAGIKAYKTYNLDKKSGKRISNKELLSRLNVEETEFIDKLSKNVENNFFNFSIEKSINEDSIEFYNTIKKSSTSKENCSINNDMYVDYEGNINVITKIGSLAGAEYYYHIITIER